MEVKVIPIVVKPAAFKKLQVKVAVHKQDVATKDLLDSVAVQQRDSTITKLQKELAELTERVAILEG